MEMTEPTLLFIVRYLVVAASESDVMGDTFYQDFMGLERSRMFCELPYRRLAVRNAII